MPQFDDISHKVSELYRSEEEELIKVLSTRYGHQYINLFGIVINTEALRLVEENLARTAELAIFARNGSKLSIAIRNPNNKATKDLLNTLGERDFIVTLFMASTTSLEHAWERYHDVVKTTASEKGVLGITSADIARMAESLKTVSDVATTVENLQIGEGHRNVSTILTAFLGGALSLGASDLHVEPESEMTRIRYRIDGALWDICTVDNHAYALIRARLKLLAGLKLNITNQAQDGRFTIDVGTKKYEIRLSVIPGAYGESIVMRFLDPSSIQVKIEQFGINEYLLPVIFEELKRPEGMIITTGPTGSGKTTTLYTFLQLVHNSEVKIITLEDPIEYHIDGIVQTQVADKYSFASGLRAILRQDPNVILVGEIRDSEVAETAMNAALTGHLVFSTLHTNSAAGAFPRLRDLGIDPRTMGSALHLVLAQRLVRKLCPFCKKERALSESEQTRFGRILATYPKEVSLDGAHLSEPVGCDKCGGSGFKGRIGIYEGIRVDSKVSEALIADLREKTITESAQAQKIPSLQQDGVTKALAGITSLTELEKVVDLHGEEIVAP